MIATLSTLGKVTFLLVTIAIPSEEGPSKLEFLSYHLPYSVDCQPTTPGNLFIEMIAEKHPDVIATDIRCVAFEDPRFDDS